MHLISLQVHLPLLVELEEANIFFITFLNADADATMLSIY